MSQEAPSFAESNAAVDPFVGRVLNERFTLLEPIGSGGMGRVYRALQSPLDRVVAVKILDSNYASGRDPLFQKRFFREASLTSRLRHPNTITVIDYGKTDDGIFFIAMEYADGKTLAEVLVNEGTLPQARVLYITQQICRSLREAHRLGIIHRDLKPANVMLLEEDAEHDLVKVLDFGLVKSILPALDGTSEEAAQLTQHGALLGSPLYMAPEHAQHQPMDARSDIYSLGVMMYHMLTGKPPFQGQSIDVIVKHVHNAPKPLRVVRPDLSFAPEVEAIVMRCLAKEPNGRFDSMDELLVALRAAGVSGTISAPRAATLNDLSHGILFGDEDDESYLPTSESAAWRRSIWPWALSALAALLLSSAGTFLFLQWDLGRSPPASAKPVAPLKPITRFVIRSNPPGAKVSVEGKSLGVTPLETDVVRDGRGVARVRLTLELEGYQTRVLDVQGKRPQVETTARMIPIGPRSERPWREMQPDFLDVP